MKQGLTFAFIGALVVAIASTVRAGTTGTLTGRVVDNVGHTPISGVRVVATSPITVAYARTDASGFFVFVSLAPDTYAVRAYKDRFSDFDGTKVLVAADRATHVTILLSREIGVVIDRHYPGLVSASTNDVYHIPLHGPYVDASYANRLMLFQLPGITQGPAAPVRL